MPMWADIPLHLVRWIGRLVAVCAQFCKLLSVCPFYRCKLTQNSSWLRQAGCLSSGCITDYKQMSTSLNKKRQMGVYAAKLVSKQESTISG